MKNTSEIHLIKTITIRPLHDPDAARRDREFWMSKTPEERIEAVEFLRRLYYGDDLRMERVVTVVQRKRG